MSNPSTPTQAEQLKSAARLKATAELKLAQSRALLLEALEEMSRLEGRGYCAAYEDGQKLQEKLMALSSRFRLLQPPTGVFTV